MRINQPRESGLGSRFENYSHDGGENEHSRMLNFHGVSLQRCRQDQGQRQAQRWGRVSLAKVGVELADNGSTRLQTLSSGPEATPHPTRYPDNGIDKEPRDGD